MFVCRISAYHRDNSIQPIRERTEFSSDLFGTESDRARAPTGSGAYNRRQFGSCPGSDWLSLPPLLSGVFPLLHTEIAQQRVQAERELG